MVGAAPQTKSSFCLAEQGQRGKKNGQRWILWGLKGVEREKTATTRWFSNGIARIEGPVSFRQREKAKERGGAEAPKGPISTVEGGGVSAWRGPAAGEKQGGRSGKWRGNKKMSSTVEEKGQNLVLKEHPVAYDFARHGGMGREKDRLEWEKRQ